MSSFSFKNVVFYIQVLVNLICVRNFGKVILYKYFRNTYNLGKNVWNNIEKFCRTKQGKKCLISTFAYFSTAIFRV